MTTGLERITAKARENASLQFTSLTHHISKERIWDCLRHIPKRTAPGVDGITQEEAMKTFEVWGDEMLTTIHRKGYRPPAVRRVWIPKPGKKEKRPLGVPAVADRALQRCTAEVLSAIYEQDFLNCSFGGRPGRGQHNALATLNEIISGKKVGWVLEADLKNFFGSLDHEWMMKFVEHRIGDPRILRLIQRWLKVGVLEDGVIHTSEEGTPQGGSISVLLSNLYLHYVLDLWFEKAIKPRLKGEAYLIRYIDDFIVCFQYRRDAIRFQEALERRLCKFKLQLEPSKTRLIEFGRFASRHAKERSKRKPETLYFLGFTHYCTRNQKGNFMVGRKTEKKRLKRSIGKVQETMRSIRHEPMKTQAAKVNQILRGHYAYYGMTGNIRCLIKVYQAADNYWRRMLSSRSQKSYVSWEKFDQLKLKFPLLRPKIFIPSDRIKAYAML
ncbi:RNA-directed DNA polymerase [Paenibacillus sp. V4I9]|uniref:group II intron reverse transcriptase/maturase n=1 Tax=Paenibacillus sp. V4I9 TaxID=3042308 RepID=UPI0027881685|nr:group II intron reverse transcriptase/maturase [Paenibacillus sp. V4I9]MDQ0890239.1 RNA-directed DNA polymerase [Paenibacillus sp. V4I9]